MFHHHYFKDNKNKNLYLPRVGVFHDHPWIKISDLSDFTWNAQLASGGSRAAPLMYKNVTYSRLGATTSTQNFRIFLWCDTLTVNLGRTLSATGSPGGGSDAPLDTSVFGGPGASGGGGGGGSNGTVAGPAGGGGSNGGNGQGGIASGGAGNGTFNLDGFDYENGGNGGAGGVTGFGFGNGFGGAGNNGLGGGGGGGEEDPDTFSDSGFYFNGAGGGGGGGNIQIVCRRLAGSGAIRANGGVGGSNIDFKGLYLISSAGGGGGGGGVIQIWTLNNAASISAFTANGGAGGSCDADAARNGSAGTNGNAKIYNVSNDWETVVESTIGTAWDNR
jgi:hypothetical protein